MGFFRVGFVSKGFCVPMIPKLSCMSEHLEEGREKTGLWVETDTLTIIYFLKYLTI